MPNVSHDDWLKSSASRRVKAMRRARRGLATGWLLIWSPIFLACIVLTVEVGNVLLAKVQLVNALESAALAAVQEWQDTNSTAAARDYAVSYARANKVSGEEVILDRNDGGGGANDNASCNGDIVLGSVTVPDGVSGDDCTQFIFDPNDPPSGGGSGLFASLSIVVNTIADTKNDIQTNNADNDPTNDHYDFQIFDFTSNDANLEIASVTFNLATVPAADEHPAYFDFRDQNGNGVGTDKKSGIEPIFLPNGINTFTASPAWASDLQSPTYTLTFPDTGVDGFNANVNDRFDFGVDTDYSGPDPGNGDNVAADIGSELIGATVTVTFRLNNNIIGSLTAVLGPLDPFDEHWAVYNFVNEEISTADYGVRTSRTMTVTPICADFFGLPFRPFTVCGQAAAITRGPSGQPQLIRIRTYQCP